MTFDSPWDRPLRISTWLVGLVAGCAFAFVLWRVLPLLEGAHGTAWPALLPPVAIVVVLGLAWALAPRRFTLRGGQLVVERPLLPVEINLSDVRSAAVLPEGTLRRCVRVAGTSGFCGYYGRFWGRSLGSFRLYATRTRSLVLLDTSRGRFVLSPEPAEKFVEAVLARAPRATCAALGEEMRPAPARPLALVAALVAAAAVVVAGGILFAVFGRAPRSVRVDGDAVRIERRWASPVEIPFGSIRGVTSLTPEQRRGWVRTAGTATGSFAYGRFYGPGLGSFQLYAWRRGGEVLLETDNGKVVVTADDPQTFAYEVRSRLYR